MRNAGVDFLFFGNTWDYIGHTSITGYPCGWIYESGGPDALDQSAVRAIARAVRDATRASWLYGVRLVSSLCLLS